MEFLPAAFHYAHRGLWTANGAPENSLAAFQAAADAGYGVEFDVRPARDGTPMVFHDATLERMTSLHGRFEDLSQDAFGDDRGKLGTSGERIPRLTDLLNIWPKHLPLLTEIKVDGRTDGPAIAKACSKLLRLHRGLFTIMSFDEATVRAVPEGDTAGQLLLSISQTSRSDFSAKLARAAADRPNYACVWHEDAPVAKNILGDALPLFVYTSRSVNEHSKVVETSHEIGIIFEHYTASDVR